MGAWKTRQSEERTATGKLRDDRGTASIEYAILGSLIAAVIVFVVASLGTQVQNLFETVVKGW